MYKLIILILLVLTSCESRCVDTYLDTDNNVVFKIEKSYSLYYNYYTIHNRENSYTFYFLDTINKYNIGDTVILTKK